MVCRHWQACWHRASEFEIADHLLSRATSLISFSRLGAMPGTAFTTHFQELGLSIFGLIYLSFVPFFFRAFISPPTGSSGRSRFLLDRLRWGHGGLFCRKEVWQDQALSSDQPKEDSRRSDRRTCGRLRCDAISKAVFFTECLGAPSLMMPLAWVPWRKWATYAKAWLSARLIRRIRDRSSRDMEDFWIDLTVWFSVFPSCMLVFDLFG